MPFFGRPARSPPGPAQYNASPACRRGVLHWQSSAVYGSVSCTGPWRWAGTIGVVAALLSIGVTRSPDILVERNGDLLAHQITRRCLSFLILAAFFIYAKRLVTACRTNPRRTFPRGGRIGGRPHHLRPSRLHRRRKRRNDRVCLRPAHVSGRVPDSGYPHRTAALSAENLRSAAADSGSRRSHLRRRTRHLPEPQRYRHDCVRERLARQASLGAAAPPTRRLTLAKTQYCRIRPMSLPCTSTWSGPNIRVS